MTTSNHSDSSVKNEKYWKAFYAVTGFIGLVLLVFGIFIFRQTIIKTTIPICIILSVGLTAFFLNKQHYKRTYKLRGNFLPLIQNIISWGFLSCYIFMATNYYIAANAQTVYTFKIREKSSMPGSWYYPERKPLVTFDYWGFEKELVFNYIDTQKVNDADSVKIVVRKGELGYDILEEYDVF